MQSSTAISDFQHFEINLSRVFSLNFPAQYPRFFVQAILLKTSDNKWSDVRSQELVSHQNFKFTAYSECKTFLSWNWTWIYAKCWWMSRLRRNQVKPSPFENARQEMHRPFLALPPREFGSLKFVDLHKAHVTDADVKTTEWTVLIKKLQAKHYRFNYFLNNVLDRCKISMPVCNFRRRKMPKIYFRDSRS